MSSLLEALVALYPDMDPVKRRRAHTAKLMHEAGIDLPWLEHFWYLTEAALLLRGITVLNGRTRYITTLKSPTLTAGLTKDDRLRLGIRATLAGPHPRRPGAMAYSPRVSTRTWKHLTRKGEQDAMVADAFATCIAMDLKSSFEGKVRTQAGLDLVSRNIAFSPKIDGWKPNVVLE